MASMAYRCFRSTSGIENFSRTHRIFRDISSTHLRRFSSRISSKDLNWKRRVIARSFVSALVPTLVFAGVFFALNFEQVPETGRWRYMTVSRRSEERLGEIYRSQTLEEIPEDRILPQNHPISQHVQRIVSRILSASNLGTISEYREFEREAASTDFQQTWNVIVVDNPEIINATAAHRQIIIFTGVLPVCRDELGLAAVLSHEIAHVVARHWSEILSSKLPFLYLTAILARIRGLESPDPRIIQSLVSIPPSQTFEREADVIGLRLMSRACYDPQGAVEVLHRLASLEGGMKQSTRFLATHPLSSERVQTLTKLVPDVRKIMTMDGHCAALQDEFHLFQKIHPLLTYDVLR